MEDNTLTISSRPKVHEKAKQFADFILLQTSAIDHRNTNSSFKKGDATSFKKKIKDWLFGGDYSAAIWLLIKLIDSEQGIDWHVTTEFINHEVLVRDARNCEKPKPSTKAYIIMAINYTRAANALFIANKDTEKKEQYVETKNYLHMLLYNFYLKTINLNDIKDILKHFEHFNGVLITNISYLLDISFEEALVRLSIAKEFTNLEDTCRSIVTLTRLINSKNEAIVVFQGEIVVTYLTDNLKDEYHNRKEKKWYQILPVWQQELVDHYYPTIVSDEKVIPTQLRKILIGLRNWYETVNGILDIANHKTVVTTCAYHSGAIIYLGKDPEENKRIGILHGKQLEEYAGVEKVLTLTLNTSINPSGNDKEIVKNTNYIMKSIDSYHANLPLNAARRISSNNYSGIYSILKYVSQHVLLKLKEMLKEIDDKCHIENHFFNKINNYLCNSETVFLEELFINQASASFDEIQDILITKCLDHTEISHIKNNCEIIKLALALCHLIHHNKNVMDADNRNLRIGCFTHLLGSKLSQQHSIAVHSACQSGKDRDGILMFRTAKISFNEQLFNQYQLSATDPKINSLIQNNIVRLAFARHQQFMAGCQGGTYGAFGIKKDSKGVIPEKEFPLEATQALIEATASFNSKIIYSKNVINRYHFPMGDTKLGAQKLAIIHVIKIHEREITSPLAKMKPQKNYRFSTTFLNSSVLTARSGLLKNMIISIEAAQSFPDLQQLFSKYASNKKLTENTPNSAVSTYDLLRCFIQDINETIKYLERKPSNLLTPHT